MCSERFEIGAFRRYKLSEMGMWDSYQKWIKYLLSRFIGVSRVDRNVVVGLSR